MENHRIVTVKPCYPFLDQGMISLLKRDYHLIQREKEQKEKKEDKDFSKEIKTIPFKTINRFYYANEIQSLNEENFDLFEKIIRIRDEESQEIIRKSIQRTTKDQKILLFFATDSVRTRSISLTHNLKSKKELVFMHIPGLKYMPGISYWIETKEPKVFGKN